MTCDCKLCQRHRRIEAVKASVPVGAMHILVDDLADELLHTELDRDYAQAIVDGSWPDADEIMRRIRARKAARAGSVADSSEGKS